MIKAFDDLAKWVHKGTKPDGDEVAGDLSNAGLNSTTASANDPGVIIRASAGETLKTVLMRAPPPDGRR